MIIKPQVAIMMPVYNGEKTLALAISSLVNQTYQNWKCYIVNDGSTDQTKEILDNLNDKRFVVIHFEKNKGRPFARQAALEAAEGKYLAFLDADDFFHPEKIEKQVKVLENNPQVLLVSCAMVSYDKNFNFINIRSNYIVNKKYFKIGMDYRLPTTPSLVYLVRAKEIGYNFDLKYAQDTDFFVRYLDNGHYANIDDALYFYSEYESVTKWKTIKTNFYGIKLFLSYFDKAPTFVIKKIITNLFKIATKLIAYPFVSSEFYLNKRGKPVTKEMTKEYEKVLKIINTQHLGY